MLLCGNCKLWELISDDLYCGWCGRSIFHLEVLSNPIRLYVDSQNTKPHSAVLIKNLSYAPLSLAYESKPAWLSIELSNPIVVPNNQLLATLRVDVQKLGGVTYKEGQIVFRPSATGQSNKNGLESFEIKVEVWPVPQISIEPVTVFSGDTTTRSEMNIELWSPINIELATFDPPYIVFGDKLPKDVDIVDSSLPILSNVPQQVTSMTQPIRFKFKVRGMDELIAGQFDLIIKKPATLEIAEFEGSSRVERQVIPNTDEEIKLTVNNTGENILSIKSIRISPVGESAGIVITPEREQHTLEPGEQGFIKLKVHVGGEAKTNKYWFETLFDSNDPDPQRNKRNLLINVIDEEYTDFVAVDFGTTDSAIAIIDEGHHRPKNVPLEKGSLDPWVYSNIFFKNFKENEDPPYTWIIGTQAKTVGPTRPELFVKAIKTRVGTMHRQQIDFKDIAVSRQLEPEQIIEFIMKDLLSGTKASLRRKPSHFILSVPTRFTLRKKEILKEALQRSAKSISLRPDMIEVIDESLAAGLFYLLIRGPVDDFIKTKESYNLMILDFGGGTTDVTVFSVNQSLGSDGSFEEIDEVEIVGAWGDATLGGEGITTEIATLLAEKFLNRTVDIVEDIGQIKKLEDEAESIKLVISELLNLQQTDGSIDLDRAIKLANPTLRQNLNYITHGTFTNMDDAGLRKLLGEYVNSGHELNVSSNDFKNMVKIDEKDVIEIFERKLARFKGELDLLLKKIDKKIEVLLLAGRSSLFPPVMHIFKDLAQHIDYVRDADGNLVLKECVSRGALYFGYHLKGDFDLKIKGWNRVWTKIGRIRFKAPKGTVFEELIPWGKEYPFESKTVFLTPAHVKAGKLEFEVLENLSLSDEPHTEPYGKFEFNLNGLSEDKYPCKLQIDERGEIKALCEIQGEWKEMKFKL